MVGIRIEMTPKTRAALARLTPAAAAGVVRASIREWGPYLHRTLAQNSPGSKPGNTGNFRRGWELKAVGDNGLLIRNVVRYAIWVEENTRKHVIRPVRAQVLAWRKLAGRVSAFRASDVYRVTPGMRRRAAAGTQRRGDWSFAGAVNHPGTTGQHPLRRSIEEEAPRLLNILYARLKGLASA